jgi:hypothetical protein
VNVNPIGWASSSLRLVARLFNSGVNSTTPVTAISEAPLGVANADIALVAKGTGAVLAQVPDGTVAAGNKRGTSAVDWQKERSSITQVASGNNSVIGGGGSNTASQGMATIAGGQLNVASALYSAITGGYSNDATSSYSFAGGGQSNAAQTNTHATVCGGNSNTASGQYSFVGGGQSNTASGLRSGVLSGTGNTASGTESVVCGGENNLANAANSYVAGGRYGTARSIIGYHVFPAIDDALTQYGTAYGLGQSGLLLLARQTTDATATVLTSNSSAASTTNQVILPNNSAYSFSGEVIAGVTGAGDTARWTINGAIKRGANAASTTMVGTATVTMTHFDAGAATWLVAVTADTTNGGIKVEVTGAAATTIRWVCKINTTEMTF